jgi:hypothetical protein
MKPDSPILDLPCPSCATFSLLDEKLISCQNCDYTTRRLPLKTAYDYAAFVFKYGHQYKQYYEDLLSKGEKATVLGNIADPHQLHTMISLPLLSGVVGNTSIFLVKAAISTLVDSYNEHYQTDFTVPDEDINTLFGNFRVFVNNFADADPKIRNAVFEEMFMAECSKKESEKLVNLQKKAEDAKGDQRIQLQSKAEKMLNESMRSTFKKLGDKPKPTPEELSGFWLKVIK